MSANPGCRIRSAAGIDPIDNNAKVEDSIVVTLNREVLVSRQIP